MLLDLDAFFASVEQLDHPEWRGRPVIVGGSPQKRGVVATCSYEARAFGVHSAMPSAQAARLCPEAIWTAGNFPRYIELSQQVIEIMYGVSPFLQQVSIDEAFLDVTPGRYTGGHPIGLARTISAQVQKLGITCSIGLGSSKTVAKIASDQDKPSGLTVVFPGVEAAFLAPLPVRTLSGVGRKAEQALKMIEVVTLGDLAKAEISLLKPVFGKNAELMRLRAAGIDPAPVETEAPVKSVSNEMTFSVDLVQEDDLLAAIAMLSDRVGRRLRHKGLAGQTVTLKLRFHDLSIHSAQKTLARLVNNEFEFAPVAQGLLGQIWRPGDLVRLVGVGISGFSEGTVEQLGLFNPDLDSGTGHPPEQPGAFGQMAGKGAQSDHALERSLAEATDHVRQRFGEKSVGYGRDLRFRGHDTGTVGQKKDDYKDPLHKSGHDREDQPGTQ